MRTIFALALAAFALTGCASAPSPTPSPTIATASPRASASKPGLTAICTSEGDVSAAVMPVTKSRRISTLSISNDGNEKHRPMTGYPNGPYQNVLVTPFDANRPVLIEITLTDGTHLTTSKTCN